ncbi:MULTISPECIES: hypothetical protein [unclassified Bradyrhizobium]|uniref:hypothetical protein n=1 Tax=unclassified Bradyrhizobium TaxID=2631580 RepID=UPI002FF2D052
MGDGIVAAQHGDGAPYADCSGLDNRPDLISFFPPLSFIGRQVRFARLVALQIESPDRTSQQQKPDAHPDQIFAGLQRRQARRDGQEEDADVHRTLSFEQRIDQRRRNLRRYLSLIWLSALICELHRGCTGVLVGCVVLPSGDEVFLREHRYRDVAFDGQATKFA